MVAQINQTNYRTLANTETGKIDIEGGKKGRMKVEEKNNDGLL
jgi:hypothetical protein